jgi:putative oxidoreductase
VQHEDYKSRTPSAGVRVNPLCTVIHPTLPKEGAEMNMAFLVGRIIFGGYWLMASFNHFKNLNYMSEYAKARGTPSPKVAVAGTGVILLAGGLSMLLGVYPMVGTILLIVFLLGVSFQIHSFWKVDDAVLIVKLLSSCKI